MSENLTLSLNVTMAVFGGLILLAVAGVIVNRIFARHER
jgi:hypothetical protein